MDARMLALMLRTVSSAYYRVDHVVKEAALHLVTARIRNYKCVLDSGEFTLGDMICFVGKNESGKTAILEAVEKIHSARPSRADFKETDFPRMLGEQDEDHETVVSAKFELTPDEVKALQDLAGPASVAITADTFTFTRGYNNKGEWLHTWDAEAATTALIEASALPPAEKKLLADVKTPADLI